MGIDTHKNEIEAERQRTREYGEKTHSDREIQSFVRQVIGKKHV